MAATAQKNNQLILKLGSTEVQCQVINLDFKRPGYSAGTTIETACPDGVIVEPGAKQDGSLTGEAFTDTADGGLWSLLDDAYEDDVELAYELTFFGDLGATLAVKFTGTAKVNSSGLAFSKPGMSRHPLDLAIITAVKSRPAA